VWCPGAVRSGPARGRRACQQTPALLIRSAWRRPTRPCHPRPSSSGPGRRPFTAKTGVRFPLGAPVRCETLRSSSGWKRFSHRRSAALPVTPLRGGALAVQPPGQGSVEGLIDPRSSRELNMKSSRFALAAVAILSLSGIAQAQGTIRGAEEGAAAGNNAAGPVGGIVGGAVGAATGTVGGVLGVGDRPRSGCSTESVTKKDGDTGDTVKKTTTNC